MLLGLALARIAWKLVSKGQPVRVALARPQRINTTAGHGLMYLLIPLAALLGALDDDT